MFLWSRKHAQNRNFAKRSLGFFFFIFLLMANEGKSEEEDEEWGLVYIGGKTELIRSFG